MQQTRLLRFYAIAFFANTLFFCTLYVLFPGLRDSFIEEDRLLENLTAILAFNSFLLGLLFLLKYRRKYQQQPYQKLYWLLPVSGLLLFLDELSFGKDVFGLEFLTVGGMEIDSLHDFVSLFYKQIAIPAGERGSLWYGAASLVALAGAALLGRLVHRYRHRTNRDKLRQRLAQFNQTYPPFLFIAIAIGLGGLATTVDLRILQFKGAKFLEELFEMNAALAILLACFAIKIAPEPDRRSRQELSDAEQSIRSLVGPASRK